MTGQIPLVGGIAATLALLWAIFSNLGTIVGFLSGGLDLLDRMRGGVGATGNLGSATGQILSDGLTPLEAAALTLGTEGALRHGPLSHSDFHSSYMSDDGGALESGFDLDHLDHLGTAADHLDTLGDLT